MGKKKLKCNLCGKVISEDEAEESCKKMRFAMQPNDPNIFDIWFGDYCDECAEKYIKGEITEL